MLKLVRKFVFETFPFFALSFEKSLEMPVGEFVFVVTHPSDFDFNVIIVGEEIFISGFRVHTTSHWLWGTVGIVCASIFYAATPTICILLTLALFNLGVVSFSQANNAPSPSTIKTQQKMSRSRYGISPSCIP